jgi:hypothetical protein
MPAIEKVNVEEIYLTHCNDERSIFTRIMGTHVLMNWNMNNVIKADTP